MKPKLKRKILPILLVVCMAVNMLPARTMTANAAVSAGINDMTALDALGIDISDAPIGYDANTTSNPFGRETKTIAVVDELFVVGKSTDNKNYTKLYGDNWKIGNTVSSFLSSAPTTVGNATTGSQWIFDLPWADNVTVDSAMAADALAMTEANLDISKENDGLKNSTVFVSYKNSGSYAGMNFGIVAPQAYNAGYTQSGGSNTVMHDNISMNLDAYSSFGNKEDKLTGDRSFRSEYAASMYMKISAGDYDGDGIDEVAFYVPNRDEPRIEIYKLQKNWSNDLGSLRPIMTYPLDTYKATKRSSVSGVVITNAGDTLIPNMVSMVSEDFDMDGIDDLAISYGYSGSAMASAPCKAIMLFGVANGQFGLRQQEIPLTYNKKAIIRASFATGDVDGDTKNELVVGGNVIEKYFNKDERYVAIYKWDGSKFVVSQSKNFDLFEADSNGNYVNTNVPEDKIRYHSLPCAPANIAVGRFNGLTEPMNIYIDSMLIEIGDNGLELAGTLDDDLQTNTYYYAEWGARAAQLTGDGKDTLITMTRDVSNTLINLSSNGTYYEIFDQLSGFLYSTGTKYTRLSAVYGSNSGMATWKNQVDGTAFCLPNTDNDTSKVKYTGEHYFTYIDPEILAVLASPPYFKDLNNDEIASGSETSSTSYRTSQGSGSGSSYSNTLSVGLYTSYEKSVSLFGVELFSYEAEMEINNHMTWETIEKSSIEQSVSYETLAGQDTVVFFSLPVETYVYEQVYPVTDKNGNITGTETQTMTVNIPHEASVRNLPLETYERIAADYDELPKIEGTVLTHTVGVPSSYPGSVNGYGNSDASNLPKILSSGNPAKIGYGTSSQTKEITMTNETEKSFHYELDISTKVGVGAGGVKVGITAGYEHGAGTVSINTSGSAYSGTIYSQPAATEPYGYDFNWKLFAYPYTNGKQTFPVVTYLVTDVTQPPQLPDNFLQFDEGTTQTKVALTWQHSGNPAGFTIYRYFRAAGSAGFYDVAYIPAADMNYITSTDGNTKTYQYIDKGLSADTEYEYRIQTVGSAQPGLSVQSETLTAYTKPEGIIPEVAVNTNVLTIYPDTEHTATVSITNSDLLSGATLFFQWQQYDETAKIWSDLPKLTTMTIRFSDAGMSDAGKYRCKVTSRQNTTIVSSYSPTVDVIYSKRRPTLSDLSANGNELSVTITGSKTKTIPSGTVVFTLEKQGYTKQYAANINSQGIAKATVSAVPGIYKVTAAYNGNRVFKPEKTETGTSGKAVFCVFGQVNNGIYWDYADTYRYGDKLLFTQYTIDENGAVTDSEAFDFREALAMGKNLWRQMEIYTLPSTTSTSESVRLTTMPVTSDAYRPLVCNDEGTYTNGVENVLGGYLDTVIGRFNAGKAGWKGNYCIPYDMNGDGTITNFTSTIENNKKFNTSSNEPEGFYFTVKAASIKVDFKAEYKNITISTNEEFNRIEHKVVLTAENYGNYGFTEEEWKLFQSPISKDSPIYSGIRGNFTIDGQQVQCRYTVGWNQEQIWLNYRSIEPDGIVAKFTKNENMLECDETLFDDNLLDTVSSNEITDTGMYANNYRVNGNNGDLSTFSEERLFTAPTNMWLFPGHYWRYTNYYGTITEEISQQEYWGGGYSYTADNYNPEQGLNIMRYDRFGDYTPIDRTTGTFTLGIEPVYYVNYYEGADTSRRAYPRAHVAQNYDIDYGKSNMMVTGPIYPVAVESDDEVKGSVTLKTPAMGVAWKYPVGTQFVFVAAPNEGFEVDYWTLNGSKTQISGTQLIAKQTDASTVVKVYFKAKTNTLTYSADPENPSVNGSPVENKIQGSIASGKEPMPGAEIELTADAATGWHFHKWEVHTDGGATQYVTGNTLSHTMPNASVRVYGIFERDSYTLTLGKNLIAVDAQNNILDTSKPIAGDTVITVKPEPGYELNGEWSATNGVENSDSTGDTFSYKVLKNTEISTAVRNGIYQVTMSSQNAGGSIQASGAENMNAVAGGTALSFTAVPERGYQVEKWILNGESMESESETYSCIVDSDLEVSVVFEKKESKIVTAGVSSGSHAKLRYSINSMDYTETYSDGKITLYEGEVLTVTAAPYQNSMVAGWRIDNVYKQSYEKTYTISYTDAKDDAKVEVVTQSMFNNKVEFEMSYGGSSVQVGSETLIANVDGVAFESNDYVGAGQNLEFTFDGKDEIVYRWTKTYAGGEEMDILNDYGYPFVGNHLTLPYTEDDVKIKAYFKAKSEIETATITAEGMNIDPEASMLIGQTVTVTVAAPGEGKRINNVIADYGTKEYNAKTIKVGSTSFIGFDAVTMNENGTYTCVIGAIPGDVLITSETVDVYTVTIGSMSKGIVLADPVKAAEGDIVKLNITSDEGYVLKTLTTTKTTGGNETVEISESNTFTMPAYDITVNATFVEAEVKVAPGVTGLVEMSLREGYTDTSTSAYTITGTGPVTVTKTSGNDKIKWNDITKKLEITAGLMAGKYPVVLTGSNGTLPDATLTFTLTVTTAATEPPVETPTVTPTPSVKPTATPPATPTITKVTVIPNTFKVVKGKTKSFIANVIGTNNPDKTVTWKITGNKNSNTKISSGGVLKIAARETATRLTVIAISKQDKTKTGLAMVTVILPKTSVPNTKAVPASKKLKKGAKITLQAPEKTVLYYTTNGKKPTRKSKSLKAGKRVKITITRKTIIRVFAIKTGCNTSDEVKRTYTLKK